MKDYGTTGVDTSPRGRQDGRRLSTVSLRDFFGPQSRTSAPRYPYRTCSLRTVHPREEAWASGGLSRLGTGSVVGQSSRSSWTDKTRTDCRALRSQRILFLSFTHKSQTLPSVWRFTVWTPKAIRVSYKSKALTFLGWVCGWMTPGTSSVRVSPSPHLERGAVGKVTSLPKLRTRSETRVTRRTFPGNDCG